MTLQMDAAQAGDVTEQRQVEAHHIAQVLRIGDEPLDAVVGGGRMRGYSLIPVRPVDGRVVMHRCTVPQASRDGLRLSGSSRRHERTSTLSFKALSANALSAKAVSVKAVSVKAVAAAVCYANERGSTPCKPKSRDRPRPSWETRGSS